MQRIKTFEEVAAQSFLNIADIQKLLGISYRSAKKAYALADQIDRELGEFRIEPHKVRMRSLMKVTGLDLNMIRKQQRI